MQTTRLRLRNVKPIREALKDFVGEPRHDLNRIFPLSPSSVTHGIQDGCSLPRWLERLYGWKTKKPSALLRGLVIDAMLMQVLKSNMMGAEWKELDIIDKGLEVYQESKEWYDLSRENGQWIDQIIGWGLVVIRELAELVPYSVQEDVFLYLGEDAAVESPQEYKDVECSSDWVYGKLDWTERSGGLFKVRDLKATSKPQKSVGKHSLQLHSYATALHQKGLDIRNVGLVQFDTRKCSLVSSDDDDFTRLDYDRVIRIYREARDHYRRLVDGTGDFVVPFRGVGKCSSYSCWYYEPCPFGGNRASARMALEV